METFGADEITCKKCVKIDPVYQEALDGLAKEWDNIGYPRDEIKCPSCGKRVIVNTYDAEEFDADSDIASLEMWQEVLKDNPLMQVDLEKFIVKSADISIIVGVLKDLGQNPLRLMHTKDLLSCMEYQEVSKFNQLFKESLQISMKVKGLQMMNIII